MAGATRRRVILGGAALALVRNGVGPATAATDVRTIPGTASDRELLILGVQLQRLGRQVRTQYQQFQSGEDDSAWQRWSDSCAELDMLCERIARTPATSLAGLAVRYEALAIGLLDDGVLMDEEIKRQVLAFRRQLRHLTRPEALSW